jgi:putative aminopeptidase FrvX
MKSKQKIQEQLTALLGIASPTGYTENIVAYVKKQLEAISVPCSITNRGALIAHLGKSAHPKRVIIIHLDTLGAMLSENRIMATWE